MLVIIFTIQYIILYMYVLPVFVATMGKQRKYIVTAIEYKSIRILNFAEDLYMYVGVVLQIKGQKVNRVIGFFHTQPTQYILCI